MHVWQALLLVQAQLTQEFGHLTTPPEFANRLVDIISQVMHPASNALPNVQLVLLTLLKQLWVVIRNIFHTPWLARVSSSILRVVLSQHYDLTQEDVKTRWGDICASLILADSPEILHKLATSNEAENEAGLTRYLWTVLAKTWLSSRLQRRWEDTVSFLTVPLR